jgi:hypothetical protein
MMVARLLVVESGVKRIVVVTVVVKVVLGDVPEQRAVVVLFHQLEQWWSICVVGGSSEGVYKLTC